MTFLVIASLLPAWGQTPPSYVITDLGILPGEFDSSAHAINSLGHITGNSGLRPFLYTPETGMKELPRLPQFGNDQRCAGILINRQDTVVVRCQFVGDPGFGDGGKSFIYSPSAPVMVIEGARAVNDAGQIAGYAKDPNGRTYSFIYTPGAGYQNITDPGFDVFALTINNTGQVTGYVASTTNNDLFAFIYSPQSGLTHLSAGNPPRPRIGFAINDAGMVVGTDIVSPSTPHGFLYRPDTGFTDLGLAGDTTSINNPSDVVGNGFNSPFLYNPSTGYLDLTTLLPPNSGWTSIRPAAINDSGQIVGQGINQAGLRAIVMNLASTCGVQLSASALSLPASGGSGTFTLTTGQGCSWSTSTDAPWLAVTPQSGAGNRSISYLVAPNLAQNARIATITSGGATILVTQAPATACHITAAPAGLTFGSNGGQGNVAVTTDPSCSWNVTSSAPWIAVANAAGTGSGSVSLTVGSNPGAARSATLTIGDQTVVVVQSAANQTAGTRFIPITPCRIADTRTDSGKGGPFGAPYLSRNATRDFPVLASSCGIPATARAYALNITAIPYEGLGYVTVWPAGQPYPLSSTLNSTDGSIVANAAIVSAGAGGAVSVLASNLTDVILDINGYFVSSDTPQALAFYPLTPCRTVDTRPGQGTSGAFGPPSLPSGFSSRSFPLRASGCAIPASAQAYSLNFTAIPNGRLSFMTVGPSGMPQPPVSTLNSWNGQVVANAAIVPAGSDGSIDVYSLIDPGASSDLVIDINGYFAPPDAPGALSFYPVTPCRTADTRIRGGALATQDTRDFQIQQSQACPVPQGAQAYSLNVTAVPTGPVSFLTVWPAGVPRPLASTLNSFNGRIVANAAIVPAGTAGAISIYALMDRLVYMNVVLDLNGYFAP